MRDRRPLWIFFAVLIFGSAGCGSSDKEGQSPAEGTGGGSAAPSQGATAGTGGNLGGGSGLGGLASTGGVFDAEGGTLAGGTGGLQVGTGGVVLGTGGGSGGTFPSTGGAPTGGTLPGTGGAPAGGTLPGTGGAPTGGTLPGTGGTPTGGTLPGTGGTTTGGDAFDVSYELASDVDAAAPGTVGIVTFTVNVDVSDARIEFGLDTTYGMVAPVDLEQEPIRTLLLGMKPESSYHFRIVASDGVTEYTSDDYVIETGPATTAVRVSSFNVADVARHERGFIVTSYWQGNGSRVAFILDADGEIVWWYDSGMNGIARAAMSADGQNMWMITPDLQGAPLRRVSMDTLDAQTYSNTTGSHDITPVSGTRMAYLDYGESDCNSIFEIDPGGTTTEVFESSDVISGGGCHGNAVRYSQHEDVYTFSDVNQDVFVVNRSGSVEWRLSEITSNGNQSWGGTQHGHQLLDSSILVFANRAAGNASAAIEYTLDGQELLRYEGGYSSANLGDVQRLPGGNTLVTFSNDSVIQEIDSSGDVVLEIDGGGSFFGYALWRETLYGPPPDIEM